MTNGRRKLAELFDAWVEQHGLSQVEIAAMGGPDPDRPAAL